MSPDVPQATAEWGTTMEGDLGRDFDGIDHPSDAGPRSSADDSPLDGSQCEAVAIGIAKGGSGKSTTVAGLAIAAREDGCTPVVLDLDPRKQLVKWSEVRRATMPAPDWLHVISVTTGTLHATMNDLRRRAACDLILIDTPGSEGLPSELGMRAADFTLVVSRPSMMDIPDAVNALRLLTRFGKPHAVTLTQVLSLSKRVAAARTLFESRDVMTTPPMRSLVDHQDAMAEGLTATEYNATGQAAAENRALWSWVRTALRALPNGG